MKPLFFDKEQAFRYFLGELTDTEQTAVEERFFADENFSSFLDATETALVNEYVGGKLSYRQTQSFERRYLISERRREKLRTAQILQLKAFVAKPIQPAKPLVSWRERWDSFFRAPRLVWANGLATVTILLLFGGLWFFNAPEKNETPENRIENQMSAEQSARAVTPPPTNEKTFESKPAQKPIAAKQKSKLTAKLNVAARAKRQRSPRVKSAQISAFALLPPMQSSEKPLIVKTRDEEKIRLRVVHRNVQNFARYRVEIHASDGDVLWSREIAVTRKTAQKPLALAVRSGALAAGSYELTMSGATADGQLEEINNFNFSVLEK